MLIRQIKMAYKAKRALELLYSNLWETDILQKVDADRLICACNDVDAIIIELEGLNDKM